MPVNEWPLWEIFIRGQHGMSHRHVGSLHAADAEHAIKNARETSLASSSTKAVADIAAKSVKEASYHLERSADTVIALGDGTEESHQRMSEALDYLWPYTGEMFIDDDTDQQMADTGVAPLPSTVRPVWDRTVNEVLQLAQLPRPESTFAHQGGRNGRRHTEHIGHLLAQMQVLQRSYPEATW